jgi:hypothetical protein
MTANIRAEFRLTQHTCLLERLHHSGGSPEPGHPARGRNRSCDTRRNKSCDTSPVNRLAVHAASCIAMACHTDAPRERQGAWKGEGDSRFVYPAGGTLPKNADSTRWRRVVRRIAAAVQCRKSGVLGTVLDCDKCCALGPRIVDPRSFCCPRSTAAPLLVPPWPLNASQ